MNSKTGKESSEPHPWRFHRIGGLDQVSLETGADLLALDNLDQKLWVALSCPTQGLEFDEKTLQLIDTDNDSRIRPPELIAAIQWAAKMLKDPDVLIRPANALPLTAIADSGPAGLRLISAARKIFRSIESSNTGEISSAETSRAAELFGRMPFNGDGVVPAASAPDEETRAVLSEIISTVGATADRGGQPGVDAERLATFFNQLDAFAGWWAEGEGHSSSAGSGVLPLGDGTPGAYEHFRVVKEKIDDYFARCRLTAYDARAAGHLNCAEGEYARLAEENLATLHPAIAALPLAHVAADQPLSLTGGLNPAWEERIATFRSEVLQPLQIASSELREEEWRAIKTHFAPFEKWMIGKQGASVEKLGIARVRELIQSPARANVQALIAKDLEMTEEAAVLDDLDRLVRYHRDLFKLTRNFVSFADFYARDCGAIFQVGVLFLDSRSCELCVRVNDPNAHSVLATLARCFIAYCECRRPGAAPIKIAAVFSNGDSDNLMVGRNGLFYDRQGRDWDATIVRIVDNPISIRQAFWSPYKKFVRFVDDQLAKRAAVADEAATKRMAGVAESTANADKLKAPEARRIEVGTVAAIGVAMGSIGTFLALILIRIIEFGPWLPLVFVAIILIISCPSMFLAWIKLRQRTLGPILDASGWAINGRVRIGMPLAKSLTGIRRLPPGSTRDLADRLAPAESRPSRVVWLLLLLVLTLGGYYYFHQRAAETPFPLPPGPRNQEAPAEP